MWVWKHGICAERQTRHRHHYKYNDTTAVKLQQTMQVTPVPPSAPTILRLDHVKTCRPWPLFESKTCELSFYFSACQVWSKLGFCEHICPHCRAHLAERRSLQTDITKHWLWLGSGVLFLFPTECQTSEKPRKRNATQWIGCYFKHILPSFPELNQASRMRKASFRCRLARCHRCSPAPRAATLWGQPYE